VHGLVLALTVAAGLILIAAPARETAGMAATGGPPTSVVAQDDGAAILDARPGAPPIWTAAHPGSSRVDAR
jgi:hypothetical protein